MSYQHDPTRRHPIVDQTRDYVSGNAERPDLTGVVMFVRDIDTLEDWMLRLCRTMCIFVGREVTDKLIAERDRLQDSFDIIHDLRMQQSFDRKDSIHWVDDEVAA